MKQQWRPDELFDQWTLTQEEITQVRNISQTDFNRLSYGVFFKYYQREGKFPQRKQEIPSVIVKHIAEQLQVKSNVFDNFKLKGRTARRYHLHPRQHFGFRAGTIADANVVLSWLFSHEQLLEEHNFDRLKEVVYERYKELKIEPPEQKRIERLIHSAVHSADNRLYTKILEHLSPERVA